MKLFSTKSHGILDYAVAGGLLVLPRALGWGPRTTRLLTGAGLATLAYSVLTRYELGVFKVLPMGAHLALDIAQGATLIAAPMFLGDETPDVAAAVTAIGMFEIAAALETELRPGGDEVSLGREAVEALEQTARAVMSEGAVGG